MKGKRETMDVNLFVREIKKRPALYDENLLDYKDFQTKLILWSEIAEIVCKNNDTKTVEKLKSKWKNIRDSYMRAHRIHTKKISKGIASREPKNSIMKFILPHAKAKRTKYNSDSDDSSDTDPQLDTNQEIEMIDSEISEYNEDCPNSYDEAYNDELPLAHFAEKKLEEKYDDDDETETFFRSISKTVKRLTPINRALVKKAIANVVLDVEVREARDLQNVK